MDKHGALRGIKVADFSWAAAGPLVSQCLAHCGGQVVRVESITRADGQRTTAPFKDGIPGIDRAGMFAYFNTNKYGFSLDLNHPKGVEVARRLICWADIVVENFRPGIMRKWGLAYEDIVKIKPEIIMLSTSAQGQTGSSAYRSAFGIELAGLAGFSHFIGWPDRAPRAMTMAYTDTISPPIGIVAVMVALAMRHKTGKGQWIDLSQFECGIQYLSPALMDYDVNGQQGGRQGNSHYWATPHGVYRCKGDDRWCVIAVFTDEEWKTFCRIIEHPAWTNDPELASILNRKKREDEINRLVEEWTINCTPEEIVTLMQANGIAAGIVENNRDTLSDPQLRYRNHLVPLDHPVIGMYEGEAPPFKLSETPPEVRMPAPCYGEHNEYVCSQLLGMSDKEFIELSNEGVFK